MAQDLADIGTGGSSVEIKTAVFDKSLMGLLSVGAGLDPLGFA